MNRKGQISISLATAFAAGFTIIGSITAGVAAYYNALRATDATIAHAEAEIAVLQTQKDNLTSSLMEIKTTVEKVNDKVDALLVHQGINPDRVVGKNAQ